MGKLNWRIPLYGCRYLRRSVLGHPEIKIDSEVESADRLRASLPAQRRHQTDEDGQSRLHDLRQCQLPRGPPRVVEAGCDSEEPVVNSDADKFPECSSDQSPDEHDRLAPQKDTE